MQMDAQLDIADTPFSYLEENDVRVVIKDGVPWWVAKDVCLYFGETNYRRAIARLDADEKDVSHIDTNGGKQKMVVVSQSGLYALLFNMQPNRSNARHSERVKKRIKQLDAFIDWVTGEVLPSIRKYGAYITPKKAQEIRDNPDMIISLALELKKERELKERGKEKTLETFDIDIIDVNPDTIIELAMEQKQESTLKALNERNKPKVQ